ncbi:MAG: right-handed parallel beta-helix repeat-containing protein [Saprospiraceae bacterium]|nr:right-handed parallel beta-helix repeat-containing protein [Saprospiraceae bacterium]
MDETIVEANNKWSQIGFEINQSTEFDHREKAPLQVVETDENGEFVFSGITSGEYNLALVKAGWGIKYIWNIEISSEDHVITGIIDLFSLIELDGDISVSYIFESGRSYIVTDDANFVPGSDVIIEGGSQIFLIGNNLSFWGTLTVESNSDDYFLITNASGMDRIDQEFETIDRTGQLFIRQTVGSDILISSGKISYLENGILNENNQETNIEIDHLRIDHCGCGLRFNSFLTAEISDCVISDCNREDNGGVNIEETDNGTISNNIIVNSRIGLRLRHRTNFQVSNNYFFNNTVGFQGLYFTGRLEQNEFDNNDIADVRICGTYGSVDEPMEIEYNNFRSDTGVTSYHDTSYGNNCRVSSLEYNNFYNSVSFIRISSTYSSINTRNCYFNGLSNEEVIDALIYDDDENVDYPLIDFSEFVTIPIGEAGILPEGTRE